MTNRIFFPVGAAAENIPLPKPMAAINPSAATVTTAERRPSNRDTDGCGLGSGGAGGGDGSSNFTGGARVSGTFFAAAASAFANSAGV